MSKCSVSDCKSKIKSRNLCGKHYKRWQRHGDPEVALHKYDGKWKERKATYDKQWQKDNKDLLDAYNRNYYKNNKNSLCLYYSFIYFSNKDKND